MGIDDFDGTSFAMGTVTGMRAFNVAGHKLRSPMQTHEWTPGENKAACYIRGRSHRIGGERCSCGFYAYYNGSNDYLIGTRVAAVVEGYGHVTYGPRGFRSEKARIVALVRYGGRGAMRSAPMRFLIYFWLVYWMLFTVMGLTAHQSDWWVPTVTIACMGVVLVSLFGGPSGGLLNGWRLRRIAKYYGVPLYRTQRAALKAHPLSAPMALPDEPGSHI